MAPSPPVVKWIVVPASLPAHAHGTLYKPLCAAARGGRPHTTPPAGTHRRHTHTLRTRTLKVRPSTVAVLSIVVLSLSRALLLAQTTPIWTQTPVFASSLVYLLNMQKRGAIHGSRRVERDHGFRVAIVNAIV